MTHTANTISLFNKFADSVRELSLETISEIGLMFLLKEIKVMVPLLKGKYIKDSNQKIELASKWLVISAAYLDEKSLEENKVFLARKCTSHANPKNMIIAVNKLISNIQDYDLIAGEEFKGPKFSAIELEINSWRSNFSVEGPKYKNQRDNLDISQDYNKTIGWANSSRPDNNSFGFSFEEFILVEEYEDEYLVRKNDSTFKENSPYKEENWLGEVERDLEEAEETKKESSNLTSDEKTVKTFSGETLSASICKKQFFHLKKISR